MYLYTFLLTSSLCVDMLHLPHSSSPKKDTPGPTYHESTSVELLRSNDTATSGPIAHTGSHSNVAIQCSFIKTSEFTMSPHWSRLNITSSPLTVLVTIIIQTELILLIKLHQSKDRTERRNQSVHFYSWSFLWTYVANHRMPLELTPVHRQVDQPLHISRLLRRSVYGQLMMTHSILGGCSMHGVCAIKWYALPECRALRRHDVSSPRHSDYIHRIGLFVVY